MNGIDKILASARPQVIGALLRYFRDMDSAEDAFQEASVRALRTWTERDVPRDPVAWLIVAGRNIGLDDMRRRRRHEGLPSELPHQYHVERTLAEHVDSSHYRDDLLRLLFICCHPDLPAAHQIALALRVVSGLSVKEIARAFLITESAMEQRITRARRRIAESGLPFETPGAGDRAQRVSAVSTMIYLLFNEGYSASGGDVHVRLPLCREAIRLCRLLLSLFEDDPEIIGLTALLLLQHSRSAARLDSEGGIILLENQDRDLWDRDMIAEGVALLESALQRRQPGPYQIQAAIAAVHAQAAHAEHTDWAEIERLYASLERIQPSAVVTLNRAVAVGKVHGPAAALDLIEPLRHRLAAYFPYFGVKGALLMQVGRMQEAQVVFERALELANTPAESAHIQLRMEKLMEEREAV